MYYFIRNSSSNPEKMVRYTQQRWSTIFAENASDLLTVILKECGIERNLETVMGVYNSQALDSHVNRERFRDEWFE
jgi:putative transposase